MTTKLIAVLALALLISACESTSPDAQPTPGPTAQPAATSASTPSAEATAAANTFKTGDKVKVTINGSAINATIVSLDEKAGKAVVSVPGETKERTVNLSEIVKQ